MFYEVATFEKDGASIKEGSLTYAAVDIDSILDASAEFKLTDEDNDIILESVPVYLGAESVNGKETAKFRYFISKWANSDGFKIEFLVGTWSDVNGKPVSLEQVRKS